MAGKSFSLPLFYIDSGDGNTVKMLTGKTVTLRESPDFSTTLYTLAETSTPGVYKNDNVEDKIVRLYVDGVYKSDYGTFRTYGDLTNMLASYLKSDNDGHWSLGNKRLYGVDDPVSGVDVGDRDYNDNRYILRTEYANNIPDKVLIVSDHLAAVAGKIYNSPQAAIDYAHSEAPYQSNFWKIYIYPHENSDTGYSENITMQPNIKLIGMGLVKLSGSISGLSQYTHFKNIMFQYSGNITLNNNAKFIDCAARLTGTSSVAITVDTIFALNLMLLTTHANHSIASSGNNNITGIHNKEFAVQSTDKIYSQYMPDITNIDNCDPTAPSEE